MPETMPFSSQEKEVSSKETFRDKQIKKNWENKISQTIDENKERLGFTVAEYEKAKMNEAKLAKELKKRYGFDEWMLYCYTGMSAKEMKGIKDQDLKALLIDYSTTAQELEDMTDKLKTDTDLITTFKVPARKN